MASEWEEMSVAELQAAGALLVEDGNHGENRPRPDEFSTEGIQFIRAADMDSGRVLFERAQRINEVARQRVRKGIGAGGDVLLSHKGTVGKVAYVPLDAPPFVCSPQTTFWRVNDLNQLDRRYIYFYLLSRAFREQLDSRKGETDMADYVSLTTQRTLKVTVPPLAEQKAIAEVLGALDDKIELNRRMNATLEAMARALFQSWFVDFDPVRAKLDPDRSGPNPAALDPATAALFPDSFQDSQIGHTPKGWEVRSLDKTAHYLNGLALQKYPPGDGPTLPVIKIAQLRKGDSFGADRSNTDLPPNYIVQDGDVLFSWSGSLEVELWCGGPGALNQHLFKVTSPEFPKWFFYLWTLYHLDEFRLIAADKATTMGHIQRGHLTAAKVLIPPRPLLDAMTRAMSPLIDQIVANRIQSRTLATLRDTLLPKLLSGELSVAEVEKERPA
jgi:type I restriction enzyme S subunit